MTIPPDVGPTDGFFAPASIALVGASDRSAWSLNTFENISKFGFDGPVHLVNPRNSTVHGTDAYPSLSSLPAPVDLAYVMVPTAHVVDVLREGSALGTKDFVVLTSGFGEAGPEGQERERELVELARSEGLRILGPNGNGFINVAGNVAPYGLRITAQPKKGGVGIILQSGALVNTALALARARNIGLSFVTAMGNEALLSVNDILASLLEDESTTTIAVFLESIRHPERFLDLASQALRQGTPIVALKVGRSRAGSLAAQAHTGALVGDDDVVDAALRQAGVVRVRSLEDLIGTAGLLDATGPIGGSRVGFITPSGGAASIIADRAEDEDIELPSFHPDTTKGLTEVLPPFASVHNPLDATGYVVVDPSLFGRVARIVGQDPGLDLGVLLWELPRATPPDLDTARRNYLSAAEAMRDARFPMVGMGAAITDIGEAARDLQDEVGYPYHLGGIEHGLTAVGAALRWSRMYHRARQQPASSSVGKRRPALPPGRHGTWTEARSACLLAANGIPVVPSEEVDSRAAAQEAARRFGFPVVLKASAPGLAHKSEISGVRVGVRDDRAVSEQFDELCEAMAEAGLVDAKVLVQPQRTAGHELLVGIVRDPQWGLVLAVGLGGVWVEVVRDTVLRLLPVTAAEVRRALDELRGSDLLKGARGSLAVDLDAVAEVIAEVAEVASTLGDELESLEINPLLVSRDRIEALDALITWDSAEDVDD